ncbi:carboxymuconolactone decarboxylase family protein [Flavobacterium silvaticum]|uniref:Carboxymuconolactone decarboxylase family protein n=1 Tax=Flavobacterium silvaticum TaxID=1852020 RepID=A0A972FYZ1_9FLAO|nr:carboxymuconolactone decarboxylase family protein [Flavobacterium silvaticum]NMH27396.1 carboxymuconolactone decarboxylase family protein [Flavobacterium silvaticum]
MRLQPLSPETLSAEVRYVHDEIANLIGNSQSQVNMMNADGALLGPFIPMLHYPRFGIPALSFIRTLDIHATLPKSLREIAILTVGGFYGARFELYAHEIMAKVFGIPQGTIATLASSGHPATLNVQEIIVHDIAYALITGRVIPDSTYSYAIELFGQEGVAELYFLIGGYSLIAMMLNGFDIPAPGHLEG